MQAALLAGDQRAPLAQPGDAPRLAHALGHRLGFPGLPRSRRLARGGQFGVGRHGRCREGPSNSAVARRVRLMMSIPNSPVSAMKKGGQDGVDHPAAF
jgi:hypothetical protein